MAKLTGDERNNLLKRAAIALRDAGFSQEEGAAIVGPQRAREAWYQSTLPDWMFQPEAVRAGTMDVMDASVEWMMMNLRPMRIVKEAGCKTVRDVTRRSRDDWLAIRGCGTGSADEIAQEVERWKAGDVDDLLPLPRQLSTPPAP